MKRFYLYLSSGLILWASLNAMEETENLEEKLAHEIIVDAKAREHILTNNQDYHFNFTLNDNEQGASSVEITPLAIIEDNYPLFSYLFERNIPLTNGYDYLIKLAVKKNRINILREFKKYGLLKGATKDLQEKSILLAIRKNLPAMVKFFLDELHFQVDKSNPQFILAATLDMATLLKEQSFSLNNTTIPSLLGEVYTNNNIDLLLPLVSNRDSLSGSNAEYMIHTAIEKNALPILLFLNEHNFFTESSTNQLVGFLKLAVNLDKIECVKFFLNNFYFDQNIFDEEFILTIPSVQMARLFIGKQSSLTSESTKFPLVCLFEYIQSDKPDKVRELLRLSKIDTINNHNEAGETIVTQAVKSCCNDQIFNTLAQYGADLDKLNADGFSPLVLAIREGNKIMVRLLINLHASINLLCIDKEGIARTPLMYALKYKQNDIAKIIAKDPKVDLNFKDQKNRTALSYALLSRNIKMASYFLKKGLNYESKGLALMIAIDTEKIELVNLLLGYNADANYIAESQNDAALVAAVKTGNYEITKLFLGKTDISENNKSAALSFAVTRMPGLLKTIKLLLDSGAHPDTLIEGKTTLLMFASKRNYKRIAACLIKAGANRHLTDEHGRTALMIAARYSNEKIISELLEAEPQSKISKYLALSKRGINEADEDGNTALLHAAHSYNPKHIILLMLQGGNPDCTNKKGDTPLLILSKLNETHIFQKIAQQCGRYACNPMRWKLKEGEMALTQLNELRRRSSGQSAEEVCNDSINTDETEHLSAQKGKEKEEECLDKPIEIPCMQSCPETINDYDYHTAYIALYEAILKVNTHSPHPIYDLVESLEDALKKTELEELETYKQASSLLTSLVEIETDMIKSSCDMILKDNPTAVKQLDKRKNSALINAVLNNNLAAVKALNPYVSKSDKQAALALLKKKNNNAKIQNILLDNSASNKASSCIVS